LFYTEMMVVFVMPFTLFPPCKTRQPFLGRQVFLNFQTPR
jgi:hypothetical protein